MDVASKRITPLGVIVTFLAVAELSLTYAATATSGNVQGVFTGFAITFPLLVALGFFAILWFKPHHFYPPSEYGGSDPRRFVQALGLPLKPSLLESAGVDQEEVFSMIASLVDDPDLQHLILMHEDRVKIPLRDIYTVECGRQGESFSTGNRTGLELLRKLTGTELVQRDDHAQVVQLSDRGHDFAKWAAANGHKADYFETPFGGWGDMGEETQLLRKRFEKIKEGGPCEQPPQEPREPPQPHQRG